ncbi:MAG: PBP1A family penicillin-binding protein [Candidatus Aminicenantes bacterium]|nr:PBP1A family penicillin-binding protein [Candidatus Aminicenantes bacterium]
MSLKDGVVLKIKRIWSKDKPKEEDTNEEQSLKKKRFNKKKLFFFFLWTSLFSAALVVGIAVGAYKAILKNLPSITRLEEFNPDIITYIFADNGEIIGQYANQKRIEVTYEQLPQTLINAIIATEDPRFYKHKGIDFLGILRAIREDIKLGHRPGRWHGGSTISQQLAREIFLHRGQTIRRKLKEWILAIQIEKRYSKEEILTMYCNQFNLGYGCYGVEAASNLYFDKSVSDLTLEEAAVITGIFRGPSYYLVYDNPEITLQRRNHVFRRMLEEGYIPKEEYDRLIETPLNVLPLHRGDSDFAGHFREEVRKYLYENYGKDALYREGLKVYTTLNVDYQKYAEEALRKQLRVLDKRKGWRDDKINLIEKGIEELESLEESVKDPQSEKLLLSTWKKPGLESENIVEAVVLSVESQKAAVKIKNLTGTLTNKDIYAWTWTRDLKKLIKRGDIIHVKIEKTDDETGEFTALLDQEPLLEGAFLCIEPQTGQIKAMVGGYSFKRSQWNNATQAMRQSGSVVKPFLYTAALENGYTPATAIVDEPTDFEDKWSGETWSPPNYDEKYKGRITLRQGLEESRNIITAKMLNYISPQTGVQYCRKFGITSPLNPYLSLALGAFEIKMIELVSAFTAFPNKGIRVKPYFISRIEDKDGNVLEESMIESEEVISPQIAYIMTSLLQGVVQRGTAGAARSLEKPIGGKTGTTDGHTDAWFIGFTPSLCAGTWVGHDKEKKTIGPRQSGAVAALPVFIDFMQHIIDAEKQAAEANGLQIKEETYEMPPNLEFENIDYRTGLLATPICQHIIREVFIQGTKPNRFCSYEDHMLALDYYNTMKKRED